MKTIAARFFKKTIALFFLIIGLSVLYGAEQEKIKYNMIGHGHIDPVWRWTWDEGYAEVFATFRSALDRMAEYPEMAMVVSSAQFYDWVAEADPQMFSEIKQRVAEGRWNIVGGWWVEADVNCPSGESLVRQGLYGQTFFQKHFGRMATVGFCPDTFGHPWSLPQILKSQGLDCYFYMRPELREKKELTAPIFQWQGQDGTQIQTFAILHSYGGSDMDMEGRIQQYNERFSAFMPQVKQYAVFFGVGNHGGAPTIATIEKIKSLQQKEIPGMRFSTLEKYVADFRRQNIPLTVVNDELQHHARGCYSACSDVKLLNRQSESLLLIAEKIASLNTLLLKKPYPAESLTKAWKKTLFNQFHDILAGSSIEQAYSDTRNDFGYSQSTAKEVITQSLHAMMQNINTLDAAFPESTPFIVFNPCSWEQRVPVELEMERVDRKVTPVLRDGKGAVVAFQNIATAGVKVNSRIRFVFQAEAPALGYSIYRMDFSGKETPAVSPTSLQVAKNKLENEWVAVTFDTVSGTVISYYDKKANRELLSGPAASGLVFNDWDDTWGHRIVSYDQEVGRFSNARGKILDQGPERAGLSFCTRFQSSTLTQDFFLSAHSNELSCRVRLDWQEKARVFKLSFPTAFKTGKLTYSIPYGFIERPMNGEEEPGQNWLDVSSRVDALGLALINDFACGYSVADGDMRITVLHSTAWSHHNPEVVQPTDNVRWMEQGLHEFKYALLPHNGDWQQARIAHRAAAFLEPLQTALTTNHAGAWPTAQSFLTDTPGSAAITAIKMAEDQSSVIIRCVDLSGTGAMSHPQMKAAHISFPLSLRPAEIKTIRVPLTGKGTITEVNLLEQ
jgi:alpha-mannosidase